jgi:hypothetical protein
MSKDRKLHSTALRTSNHTKHSYLYFDKGAILGIFFLLQMIVFLTSIHWFPPVVEYTTDKCLRFTWVLNTQVFAIIVTLSSLHHPIKTHSHILRCSTVPTSRTVCLPLVPMADIKTSPVPKHHNIKLCICLTLALHRDEYTDSKSSHFIPEEPPVPLGMRMDGPQNPSRYHRYMTMFCSSPHLTPNCPNNSPTLYLQKYPNSYC